MADKIEFEIDVKNREKNAFKDLRRQLFMMQQELYQAQAQAEKTNKSFLRQTVSFEKAGKAAGYAGVAFAGVTAALLPLIKASDEQALLNSKLEASYKRLGLNAQETARVMSKANAEIFANQARGLVGDEQQIEALAELNNRTRDAAASMRLLNSALDIAQSTGANVTEVAKKLGDAYNGEVGPLKELGLLTAERVTQLSSVADKTSAAREELDKLTTKYKDARFEVDAQAQANARLANDFGDLKQALGDGAKAMLQFSAAMAGLYEKGSQQSVFARLANDTLLWADAVKELSTLDWQWWEALPEWDGIRQEMERRYNASIAQRRPTAPAPSRSAATPAPITASTRGYGRFTSTEQSEARAGLEQRAQEVEKKRLEALKKQQEAERKQREAEAKRRAEQARREAEQRKREEEKRRQEVYEARVALVNIERDYNEQQRLLREQASRDETEAFLALERKRDALARQGKENAQRRAKERLMAEREAVTGTSSGARIGAALSSAGTYGAFVSGAAGLGAEGVMGLADTASAAETARLEKMKIDGDAEQNKRIQERIESIRAETEAYKEQQRVLSQLGNELSVLGNSFSILAASSYNLKEGSDSVVAAMGATASVAGMAASALDASTKQQAGIQAAFHGAAALGALALGLTTGAPNYFAAAAKHGVAAVQFGIVAGASGSNPAAGGFSAGGGGAGAASAQTVDLERERQATADAIAGALNTGGPAGGATVVIDMRGSTVLENDETLGRRLTDMVQREMRDRPGRRL